MDINFAGKNIVVTGAGQGIGRALCETLTKCGAQVYAFSRSGGPLADLTAACPSIVAHSVDQSDWTETRHVLTATLAGLRIDGLVNNAGIAICKPFEQLTEQDFDDTFNVNVKAVFNVTQTIVPLLSTNACIVNVSSLAAHIGIANHSAYSASKAALDALTRSLALELGGDPKRRIRVNSVNPTVVLTNMGRANWSDPAKAGPLLASIPLGRFAELKEVVEPIVLLLSERSSFVNGHCLPIEGGYLAC